MASVQTGLILTSVPSLGNVLKHEYAPEIGYCRTSGVYTKTADSVVGMIVTLTGGKFVDFKDANSSDPIGVMIDETVYGLANGDVNDVAVLVRGAAEVRLGGLAVSSSGATLATATAALIEAGIIVADSFASNAY